VNSLVKLVVRKIWLVTALALVLVAVYVSLGRLMLPRLHQYQAPLENYLSEQLGGAVQVDALQGAWQGWQPVITLDRLTVQHPQFKQTLDLGRLVMRLHPLQSLWQGRPVFSSLTLDGLEVSLRRGMDGNWRLPGTIAEPAEEGVNLIGLLLAQRQIQIDNLVINLATGSGAGKQLQVSQWRFHCVQLACASRGSLTMQGDTQAQLGFALNLQGLPHHPDFGLQLYAQWLPVSVDE